MGLPVWRAPSPIDTNLAATKADVTAAARSPIRRHRSPVSSRHITLRRVPSWGPADDLPPLSRFNREANHTGLNVRNQAQFDDFINTLWRSEPAGDVRPPPPESRNHTRNPEENVILYTNFDHPGPLLLYSTAPFTPFPMSETRPDNEANSRLPRDSLNEPIDGYPPGEGRRRERNSRRREDIGSRLSRLTREADALRDRRSSRHSSSSTLPSLPSPGLVSSRDSTEDFPAMGNAMTDFPPLRRMGRRHVTDGPLPSSSLRESWSPATTIDGLGDRDRSISPPNSDHWDTMLSTITPDERLPTADSSFTSAAASASFSASNSTVEPSSDPSRSGSAASSRTDLTVPPRRHSLDGPLAAAPGVCDTDEEAHSGSDTEDETLSTIQPLLRYPGPWDIVGPFSDGDDVDGPLHPTDAPPARDPLRYSSTVRSRSRDTTNLVRDYYSDRRERELFPLQPIGIPSPTARSSPLPTVLAGTTNNANAPEEPRTHRPLDSELEAMHGVIRGLAGRLQALDAYYVSTGRTPPDEYSVAIPSALVTTHSRPNASDGLTTGDSFHGERQEGSSVRRHHPIQPERPGARVQYLERLDRNLANMRSTMRRRDDRQRQLDERRAERLGWESRERERRRRLERERMMGRGRL